MTRFTIGIDIGGSSIQGVARDLSGEVLGRYDTSHAARGGRAVVECIVTAARALDVGQSRGIGVGVPGQVTTETGEVSLAVNLGIGADPYGLSRAVAAELGLPVEVENDVRTAALGMVDILVERGESVNSLTLLSIGTGISAGVVIAGELVRGAQGMAGEIGHVVVDESGPVCACGQRGCLETVAAGPAIERSWRVSGSGSAASSLFSAAAAGDPMAREVASGISGHLTTALIWMAAAYDTELVVLAGGVASTGADFLMAVRDQIASRAANSELAARRLQPAQVVLADNDNPPGPRGAALLAATKILQQRVSPATKKASKQQPLGGTV